MFHKTDNSEELVKEVKNQCDLVHFGTVKLVFICLVNLNNIGVGSSVRSHSLPTSIPKVIQFEFVLLSSSKRQKTTEIHIFLSD